MIITVTMNPAVDKTVEIENFRIGAVNRISSLRLDAGGKGINVSKTVKAIGGSSLASGLLAGGAGQFIKGYLDQAGIDNDFVFIKGETRTNVKVVDRVNHTNTDINEPGPVVSAEDIGQLERKVFDCLNRDSLLILSGSIPANVSAGIYKGWIERARKAEARVLLDADGELMREGIKAEPYLIKPNINELERLMGRRLESVESIAGAAKSLIGTGIKVIAVSLGAEGAIFANESCIIHAEGLKVEVRSTVGAGDAMVAALAVALERDYSFEKAVALSVAAGTANVATEGTQPPALADVMQYEGLVRISYVK